MPRTPLLRTRARLLLGTAVAGVVLLGSAAASPIPATAAPKAGATGLHDGMMPAGSPDAVPSSSAQPSTTPSGGAHPNGTLGGQAAVAAGTFAGQTGVDVARYQHPSGAAITWSQVAASGQSFAIVKATELYTDTSTNSPVLYKNAYLSGDVTGARQAGLLVGAYTYAHPENSATTQADDFAAAISGLVGAGDLPPVLDLEDNGGLTPGQLASWTQAFLDRLQYDTGIVPMIYTGPSFWQTSMGGNSGFGRYPLWEAHYTTAAAPAAIAGWTSYSLWQYTDSGSVAGISAAVDMSRSNGPVSNLLASPGTPGNISPSSVAAVRTSAGTVLAFVRGPDSGLWVSTAVNGTFGGFSQIPGGLLGGPAAVTANGSRIDILVMGTDHGLWHTTVTVDSAGRPAIYQPWDNLGGYISSAPAAASSTSARLLVTARGRDGSLWSRTYNAGGWQPWTSDGGTSVSAAAVDVVDSNTYRAQIVHADDSVWTNQFSAATGAPLGTWQAMGSTYSSVAPGASATASWAMGIQASGSYTTAAGVQQHWANGTSVTLGGGITSGLAMVEFGTTTVWTLARGTDGALWQNVTDGSSSTWTKVGGSLA